MYRGGPYKHFFSLFFSTPRCTGFLVLQKSNRGNRHLCYMYDRIKHSAISFGTDSSMVDVNNVKSEFVVEMHKLGMTMSENYEFGIK